LEEAGGEALVLVVRSLAPHLQTGEWRIAALEEVGGEVLVLIVTSLAPHLQTGEWRIAVLEEVGGEALVLIVRSLPLAAARWLMPSQRTASWPLGAQGVADDDRPDDVPDEGLGAVGGRLLAGRWPRKPMKWPRMSTEKSASPPPRLTPHSLTLGASGS